MSILGKLDELDITLLPVTADESRSSLVLNRSEVVVRDNYPKSIIADHCA